MLDSPSLKALSPPSITRSHTNTIPLSPSSRSCLLQAPSLHFFFSLRCSIGKSQCQAFVKVVQPAWSTTRHGTLFCRPQGPAFFIRLFSLFGYNVWNQNVSSTSASLLHEPSGNLLIKTPVYFNRARISAGCLSEIHLSVLDPCLTHCWGSQSLGKVTGSFQPTYFIVFLKSYSGNALVYEDNLGSSTSTLQRTLDAERIAGVSEDTLHSAIPHQSNI